MSPRARHLAAALLCAAAVSCGAKTGPALPPDLPESLVCPTDPVEARPGVPARVDLRLPAGVTQVAWTAGPGVRVDARGGPLAWVTAADEGDYTVRASLPEREVDGGVESCDIALHVRARGPVVRCPATITTEPLREVNVTGVASGDREITSRRWSLEDAPPASARRPLSQDDGEARFTPDVAGDYRLRFTAVDAAGESATCSTLVRAVPREGLRVELSWDPPGRACPEAPGAACDDSDVDLHVLREPGTGTAWRSDDDCHYANCNASAARALRWGTLGAADDPRLDIDDVTGHGPENVNIDTPTSPRYRVGVHYYARHGAELQAARLTIYCSGAVVARLGPVVIRNGGTPDAGDFWLAADVRPSGGGCAVTPIARPDGSTWIMSYGDALNSVGPP